MSTPYSRAGGVVTSADVAAQIRALTEAIRPAGFEQLQEAATRAAEEAARRREAARAAQDAAEAMERAAKELAEAQKEWFSEVVANYLIRELILGSSMRPLRRDNSMLGMRAPDSKHNLICISERAFQMRRYLQIFVPVSLGKGSSQPNCWQLLIV